MDTISAEHLFSIHPGDFESVALRIFSEQAQRCSVYNEFLRNLSIDLKTISRIEDIPFLPIEFFKTHSVISDGKPPQITFKSSGTTGSIQSLHPVTDVSIYETSFRQGFSHFYGDITTYTVLALLPSYLERDGSSLIYMVDTLIRDSENERSGYFLYDHENLYETLLTEQANGTKTLLIGVTYALLDFLENYQLKFPELCVMETGGMKGKRPEMLREEIHAVLKTGFGVNSIHSEYGMTELLSQAYSKGDGIFECPPWMRVMIRDINDPFNFLPEGKTGGLNIIDLANINSCSFISTQDLGKLNKGGRFEVLGRYDNSDIRGCNLLVQ